MKTLELFGDTAKTEVATIKKDTTIKCLCCGFAMNTITPYPQLCSQCRKDMNGSLVTVSTDCEDLETRWRNILRSSDEEHQQRFVSFLQAAESAYGPNLQSKRQQAMTEFNRRADATVAKGGDFARLVTAWRSWHRRCGDRDMLQIMMVFRTEATE